MSWGHLLFGFSGRINRGKYWLWVLLYLITAIIYMVVIYALRQNALVSAIIQLVFSIAVFISALAIMSKRLHDRNKSAWWMLVFVLAPMILVGIGIGMSVYGAIVSGGSGGDIDFGRVGIIGGVCLLASFAIYIWAFVELGCLRGTVGENQYGPDPLEGKI